MIKLININFCFTVQVFSNWFKMYALSSQRRYWTFGSDKEIDELRQQQNQNFILKATRGHDIDVNKFTS